MPSTRRLRIDLSIDMDEPEHLFDDVDAQTLYVLISFGCQKKLQLEYDRLCRLGQAHIWVFPLHAGSDERPDMCGNAKVILWEVLRYE